MSSVEIGAKCSATHPQTNRLHLSGKTNLPTAGLQMGQLSPLTSSWDTHICITCDLALFPPQETAFRALRMRWSSSYQNLEVSATSSSWYPFVQHTLAIGGTTSKQWMPSYLPYPWLKLQLPFINTSWRCGAEIQTPVRNTRKTFW